MYVSCEIYVNHMNPGKNEKKAALIKSSSEGRPVGLLKTLT